MSEDPGRPTPASTPPPRRRRFPNVPDDVLQRFNAKVLEPSTALRVPGQAPIHPTVYVTDRLLVSGAATDETRDLLRQAADAAGLRLERRELTRQETIRRLVRAAGLDDDQYLYSASVQLVPAGDGPAAPPDAWAVLQTFRALIGRDHPGQRQVALEHLLSAAPSGDGSPYGGGNPTSQYGAPGWGGRSPVNWIGPEPFRRPDGQVKGRRPVVAVLDTGVGKHPWLPEQIVSTDVTVLGVPIGYQDPATDPEITGVIDNPYEGTLDSDSGHGTFIAGLIRQSCPDADILAIRVMSSDGIVPESMMLDTLTLLALRQVIAQFTHDAGSLIDIVSLSFGYYHEQPDDISFDPLLLYPLQLLSAHGTFVSASAGNDATNRPQYPAAFCPHPGGLVPGFQADMVPLISVGALNPNNTTALFSNTGDWVFSYRPGAALVSTFPITFDGSAEPSFRTVVAAEVRETLDPDDFRAGFGIWSGTSFSAPLLAGEVAQELLDNACGPMDATAVPVCVDRTWTAVSRAAGVIRP